MESSISTSSRGSSNCKIEDGEWKVEEAVGGNGEAIEALRELIVYPYLYRDQIQKLGLKVVIVLFVKMYALFEFDVNWY